MTSRVDRSEAGMTLVELLVTVMVLGIAVVAMVGGMGTAILGSDINRSQARAEAEVRRYAEAVKAVPCAATCPTAYTAAGVGFTAAPGFVAAAPTVECFDTDFVAATCPTAGVQRITVSVSAVNGDATERLQLVKRPS